MGPRSQCRRKKLRRTPWLIGAELPDHALVGELIQPGAHPGTVEEGLADHVGEELATGGGQVGDLV